MPTTDAFRRSGWQVDIGGLRLDQISHQEAENLETPFSEAEVHSALMEMNGDKAPGPDGFTVAFWQSCWGFVKEEILAMFKEFHEQNTFLKSLNNTFLVLIPKKVLNEGSTKNGFGLKWLGWMWSCISSAKLSILVNGVPAGFFPSSKGLRQGDRLSPYLFVMGMEVLGALIRRAVEGGFLSGSASGLKINLGKSEIIPVGEMEDIEELAVEIGCRVGSLPSQYLGLPLGALTRPLGVGWSGRKSEEKTCAMEKAIYLQMLEKLQRDFLWGGGNMERKIHLVKWEIVCGDKERGGLGLRKLGLLNRALLGKWIWRFACERENLWKQVIVAKFGQEDDGWKSKKPNGAFALSQTFPHLFALAANRIATVEEMWDQNSDQGGWNLRFLRNFNDWEVGMVGDLLLKLRGLRPSLEEDSVSWKGGKSSKFKVKEAYSCLVNPMDTVFPEKCIWVDSVPTKVAFFAWEATWGKVLTFDRLQRRE
ncbi:putative ribonuclease H protein [Vitis vinifera]|uniref:Putative ribonuclease H protein n=1 Tax=Vitis vinifera TaxID=29760 RepID=A0A438HWQ8_VITVI|nr:putative ribonuclease H protein [Vitis vinifera]